jgi:tRNA G18 (ribose-2'-O)-methylase SpoU
MADLLTVTDPDDPRVVDYTTLKDTELRKRYEKERGVFIAEGPNVVAELLASPYPVKSLLLTPQRAEELAPALADLDAPVYVGERDVLEAIVRFRMAQGAVGCGHRVAPRDVDDVLTAGASGPGRRVVAVLEEMNDHENMGSLFRSARGLGVAGVLVGPRSADPLYRRCVRVSMGHVLHVPWAACPPLEEVVPRLSASGWTTVALTPAAGPQALDLTALPARLPDDARVAVLLGAEGPGLSEAAIAAADVRAAIGMTDGVDSLNVSVAGAIAFALLRS